MKICVPVPARTTSEALQKMEEIRPHADMMELRLDRIVEPDLPSLLAAGKSDIIVTNRHPEEGGGFSGTEEERVKVLKRAVELGAGYVDIEMQTEKSLQQELLDAVAGCGEHTKVIFSCHNFRETPPLDELLDKINCRDCAGRIVKIVTMANSMKDNLTMLGLLAAVSETGKEIIAFCMGEKGRLSRAAAPLFGSCISYASFGKGLESAPGQLTVEEMREISRLLHAT